MARAEHRPPAREKSSTSSRRGPAGSSLSSGSELRFNVLIAIITLVVLAGVVLVISEPLRVSRRETEPQGPDRAELETAREAKYREIRDLELDYRTGKLSEQDYRATDGALRAEALGILDRIEGLEGSEEPAEPGKSAEAESPGERTKPEGPEGSKGA